MPSTPEEILEAAKLLSEGDRWELIDRLMDMLPEDQPGISDGAADFREELLRRAHDRDGAVPWDQLRDQVSRP